MLNPINSCLIYGLDMLIIYVFFSRISNRKHNVLICLLLGLLLFEASSLINLICNNNVWINTIVSFLIRIVFAMLCFHFKKLTSISYAAILVVLNLSVEMIVVFAVSAMTGHQMMDYNTNPSVFLLEAISCKMFFFITCLMLSYIITLNHNSTKYQFTLLLYPLLSCFSLVIFWYIASQPAVSPRIHRLLSYAGATVLLSTILLFIIHQRHTDAEYEQLRLASENERLQLEKSYYDILEQQNHDLMIYAHDTKKHLNVIRALNSDPSIEKYLSTLSNQLNTYAKNCHSGNMLLDVMLDKYATECQINNVRFDYDVRSCNLVKVEDLDLVAVLGNLLDNALAAASVSQGKVISLETTVQNGYNVIILSNSCDTAPNAQGGKLLTTNGTGILHGHGLKSVSRTLKKYYGAYRWDYDPNSHLFIATVMLIPPT